MIIRIINFHSGNEHGTFTSPEVPERGEYIRMNGSWLRVEDRSWEVERDQGVVTLYVSRIKDDDARVKFYALRKVA